MWRVKCGSLEVDLCQQLVAHLYTDGILRLKRAPGTRERIAAKGRGEQFIPLSDVESVVPVRGLRPTCDGHGEQCR